MTDDCPPGTRFSLILRSVPSEVPTYVRLRRALKMLLRAYGFQELDIREIPPPPPEASKSTPGSTETNDPPLKVV